MDDCERVRRTVAALLDTGRGDRPPEEAVSAAFRHVRRCPACREDVPPESRGRFVSTVVLGREEGP